MKERFIRRWPTVVALFLGCLSILAADPSTSQGAQTDRGKLETTKLSVGMSVASISFLPLWVADEKGFYKEEGITEVKVLPFRGDADTLQALVSGVINVNVASLTSLVVGINSGQKFKSVWAGYNMTEFDWYAQPKFKSILQTKGGRYAVSKYGSFTDFITRYALRNAGLDPEKDVNVLQLGGSANSLAAMDAGQLEASILAHPYTFMAAEKGFVKILSMKELAPDWPDHVVYMKEDFIAKNPNFIKAFLRAHGKAIEWIKNNPEEAAKLGSKELKLKLEHSRRSIDDYNNGGWYADGRLPQKGMKLHWEISVQAGDVKEPWPDGRWLDDTFLKSQSQWRY